MTKLRVFLLAGVCIMAFGLTGCGNTLEGAGKDIEDAGEWVQDVF